MGLSDGGSSILSNCLCAAGGHQLVLQSMWDSRAKESVPAGITAGRAPAAPAALRLPRIPMLA